MGKEDGVKSGKEDEHPMGGVPMVSNEIDLQIQAQ